MKFSKNDQSLQHKKIIYYLLATVSIFHPSQYGAGVSCFATIPRSPINQHSAQLPDRFHQTKYDNISSSFPKHQKKNSVNNLILPKPSRSGANDSRLAMSGIPDGNDKVNKEEEVGLWPCNDELDKRIISVALPCIANFAVSPLIGAVDLFWVGRMGNALAIAGQSAANQVFSSTFWLASYLPSGKLLSKVLCLCVIHILFFHLTICT